MASNPILGLGEIVYDRTKGAIKIGAKFNAANQSF